MMNFLSEKIITAFMPCCCLYTSRNHTDCFTGIWNFPYNFSCCCIDLKQFDLSAIFLIFCKVKGANIEASPAAFENTIVVGTRGIGLKSNILGAKGKRIYGIRVK